MGWTKQITQMFDPDWALQSVMGGFIEAIAYKHAIGIDQECWRPGKPLKLLLAGYVGTRNTGADVRVEEMIRQFRAIIGDDDLELTIMSVDPELSAGYFRTVRQVRLPTLFPKFLFEECPKHHGVVACEGSMFKSKFASALSTMMAGALGLASVESKLAVGYGAEAGAMTSSLQNFVRKHCQDVLVICRNEPSRDVLAGLGIRTRGGADTAWTFEPAPLDRGAELLREHGWDGKKKVLMLGPINPFWWPVKPSLVKAAARRIGGQYRDEHYKSVYFHHAGDEVERKLDTYLGAIARGARAFCSRHDVFPIIVGMERLDRRACENLSERLSPKPPLFISDSHDMYELVSVLRNCSLMITSRFHAVVTSMPGLVPSAGITMDERIRNLMNDRSQPDLFLEVDEDDLGDKVEAVLQRLHDDAEEIAHGIGRTVPRQLELMGNMGIDFLDELYAVYPEFPRRDLPRTWEAHLPALPRAVAALLEEYA
jgi:polysaccharide pyruvyl transferase WcaK-like protein